MNDDLTLLASAYLDGDVTAAERAQVESDVALLAEVDRLRAVRSLLGDVEPQSISVREAQLATALGAWDRLPATERTGSRRDMTPAGIDAAAVAGAASVTAPTPINGRRRTTPSTRWLTGAAAALVLVLAGGVALQLGSDGEDDVSSAPDASLDATESLAATAEADPAERDPAPALEATEAADAADGEASELDTGIDNAAPPGENAGLDQLDNLTDLADFAATAVGAPRSPDDVPAATSADTAEGEDELADAGTVLSEGGFPRCLGVDLIVGPAVYGDVPVVVGIDEGRDVAIAYRAEDCDEVARVRLP